MIDSPTAARPAGAGDSLASDRAIPVVFGPEQRQLFGWYHPAATIAPRDCAVVLCSPLGRETTGIPRAYRHWANALSADGFATMRFDLHGTGDSSGRDEDPHRLAAWIGGIVDAVAFLRQRSGARSIVLAGVHFGGTLALAAAVELKDVDGLVLWAPVPTGKAFLREGQAFTRLLGTNAASDLPDGAEQIGGQVFGAETIAALKAFDPLAGSPALRARVLLIARDDASNDGALADRLTTVGADVSRNVIGGYAALMDDAHKAEMPSALFCASLEWLRCAFPESTAAAGPIPVAEVAAPSMTMEWRPAANEPSWESTCPIRETPIRFGDGRRLFGMLAECAGTSSRSTGILIVNSGSVSHVGPNRLYVSLARRWASLGYSTLRMDIGGLGESETPPGGEENHSYPSTAVEDIADGLAALRAKGAQHVVVAGLCSGAHAGFHAGLELEGIDGLLVVNPIVFYWKPSDPLDVDAWVNYVQARYYKQAALRWESWVKLVQAKVDIAHLARVGVTRAREVVRAKRTALTRRFFGATAEEENAAADLRRITERGTSVLLLFSEGDPGHDFLRLNYPREIRKMRRSPAFDFRVIENADHTFTAPAARLRAQSALTEHLLSRHP